MSDRKIPNGSKIKDLRKSLVDPALRTQKVFAAKCDLTPRSYRKIENENAPVKDAKLQKIAELLNTSADGLLASSSVGLESSKSNTVANLVELKRISNVGELVRATRREIEFEVDSPITTSVAALIEDFLRLLHTTSGAPFFDRFGAPIELPTTIHNRLGSHPLFQSLHQEARMQELLEELMNLGFWLFSGSYRFGVSREGKFKSIYVTRVRFSRSSAETITESHDRGYVQDRATGEWALPDDEIPF